MGRANSRVTSVGPTRVANLAASEGNPADTPRMRCRVDSSFIDEVGYDNFYVHVYMGENRYAYRASQQTFDEFIQSYSIGTYYRLNLKGLNDSFKYQDGDWITHENQ